MFYALHEGLTLIEEEGLEHRWERHHQAHLEFVKQVEALGLEMLVEPKNRIWNLNTPKVPQGVDEAKVRATLLKEHGIEIAGGFGQSAGKIFRIGVMGPPGNERIRGRFRGVHWGMRCVERFHLLHELHVRLVMAFPAMFQAFLFNQRQAFV